MEAHKFHLLSHIRFSSSRENFVVNLLLEIAPEKKRINVGHFYCTFGVSLRDI